MREAELVTFGGGGIDRAAHLRGAAAEPAERDGAHVLAIWRGKPLTADDALAWLPVGHPVLEGGDEEVFLGLDDGRPCYARAIDGWEPAELPPSLGAFSDPSEQTHPALTGGEVFAELRARMTRLSPREAELAATAKALLGWHATHRFCARCGGASQAADAGWTRLCDECGARHFPRTDPVVIMLVTHGNSVLLGRSPGWPERMFSLLAGFVEPGETLEAAVRRETFEETGVRVGRVGYLASQPWPFPSSLMIGCRGEAEGREIRLDPNELEDARWLTREELMDVLAGTSDAVLPARPGAIARFLLEAWLADRLD
ncbi:NAD(+) diphosphatase [Roseitranquillus sediminis]|uniref:NAD(+) diphosphatase n=1 Tax=Roseitranquillus sediminis TaxID=2809051 RepID=UPI001D0CAD86|nr:NAD(+) diphosphatase [Roseitranquillus sediminis]MBM9593265.1 NAD(+) diphosphatase [Roseitranquillus sediminis]